MMKSRLTMALIVGIMALVSSAPLPLIADTYIETTIPELDQYNGQLVEVTAIPLVSTFKEDEGYGVWNLLIGEEENKLLCYEDGTNIDELRQAHGDIQLIVDKNEDFKNEGTALQSIRVRGFYDGESEILNLTEIIYAKAGVEYYLETDPAREMEEATDDQDADADQQPIEKYIIYHEVGRPWLYAPAWYHYPAWWGWAWVDLHWWWRPWYDCDLRWYRDRYCRHWSSCYHDPCGYCYEPGRSSHYDSRRRGLPKDQGPRHYDKPPRTVRDDSRRPSPSKASRAPGSSYKADRYRGVSPRQSTSRKPEKVSRTEGKTYRSESRYSRPSVKSQPSRSSFRSAPSRSGPSRSPVSRPSVSRGGRRR